jgi:diguanylate cyclase (GGDEF)-like protein/PAS domain S-box-containing protein
MKSKNADEWTMSYTCSGGDVPGGSRGQDSHQRDKTVYSEGRPPAFSPEDNDSERSNNRAGGEPYSLGGSKSLADQSPAFLAAAIDAIPSGILITDRAGNVAACNEQFLRLWKLPLLPAPAPSTEAILQRIAGEVSGPSDIVKSMAQPLLNDAEMRSGRVCLHDGRTLAISSHPHWMNGAVAGRIWIFRNITGSVMSQQRLLNELHFLRNIIENSPSPIYVRDALGKFLFANKALAELMGKEVNELIGKTVDDLGITAENIGSLLSDGDISETLQPQHIRDDKFIDSRYGMRWLEITKRPIYSPLTQSAHILGVVTDVTDRHRIEAELVHRAMYDLLTGLPNRGLFMDRLTRALAETRRNKESIAVLVLDVDNFKVINDSLGHGEGDRLLINLAERLLTCVDPGDTVARLGGDEFAILLERVQHKQDAVSMAERVLAEARREMEIGGHDVSPSVSIGIVICGRNKLTPKEILRDADTAMYRAKTSGKGRSAIFETSMNKNVVERLELETELRRALDRGQIVLHYQPIVDLRTGRIAEMEALARWQHPRLGMIAPARFIPIAEDSGLIHDLGQWVLEETCRQLKAWQEEYPHHETLAASLNVSLSQLHREEFVSRVRRTIDHFGLRPDSITLEITENLMMTDTDQIIFRMAALREAGARLAIDDFGSGYSSMNYLARMPVDTLKIDREFIMRMIDRNEDDAVTRSIIHLGHALNLKVTGEGIETKDQLKQLQSHGCDYGQGYLFSEPKPVDALKHLLAEPGALADLTKNLDIS